MSQTIKSGRVFRRGIGSISLVLLVLFLASGETGAQTTRTWDGGSSLDTWSTNVSWFLGYNWNPNVNPVAGDHLVFAGNVQTTNTNNYANLTAFGNITFNNTAGAFVLNGNSITLNGNVTNDDADIQTINLALALSGIRNFNAASGNLVLGGVLSGTGGITKQGSNTLTLGVANTYTGLTMVSAGTLALANVNALQNSTLNTGTSGSQQVTFTVAGNNTYNLGGLTGGDTIALGANSLSVGANNQSTIYSGVLSSAGAAVGTGDLTKVGTGTLTLSGANTYTGVTTFQSGIVNVANLTNYGVAGSLGLRAVDTNPPTSDVGLRFMGGTLQYTGATAQSTNRDIRVGLAGATLDASGSNPSATMSFTKSTPNVDIWDSEGARTLTLTGTNSGDNLFAINWQARAGANHSSIVKSGTGTWVLTNSHNSDAQSNLYNTYGGYGGGTTISGGTLGFASGAIGGGVVNFTGNAALRWESGNTEDITTGSGAGIARSVRIADGVTATFNTSGNNVTLSNALATGPLQSGALTKSGAGTLNLTAANTYAGATTVSGGTLLVNNLVGSGTGTGTVTVASGATLGGAGTIGGNTIIQSGATHAPGNATGVMTHLGNITYNAGSNVQWELGSQNSGSTIQSGPTYFFDQVKVGGNLNFAGATTMNLAFNSSGSAVDWSNAFWDMWSIKDWLVYEVSGTTTGFSNLSLSSPSTWTDSTGESFSTARGGDLPASANFYLFQSGNNIYLRYEAVPEPVGFSLLALTLGFATMFVRPRRRLCV